ncbi:MAG: DUF1566 domain-containing protein [Bacteroidales bacterium]|jgi:hypothetical protein|nr:DUF1566 domain-containing protein [Bacteroidales bacterium]
MNKINLLIISLFIAVGLANGQVDKKVAVFDPVGEVSDNLKIIIREELSNAVVNTLGFTVLERELINKVMAESQFQMTGHVDDGQIGELGKKMGANYVCYASISSVGGNYYISCKMVDVMSAKIERQNTGITQSGLDDLFTVVSTVSRAMLLQEAPTGTSSTRNRTHSKPIDLQDNSNDLIEMNIQGLNIIIMPNDITQAKTTWNEANNACLESNAYGLEDWRLPTKLEISKMYSKKINIRGMQSYWYWSSTNEKGDKYYRQAFDADKLAPAAAKAKAFVRCIHSNGTNNFTDENGLMNISIWGNEHQVMPNDLGGEFKWREAVEGCNNLSAFGNNDWYLPSIEELDILYNNKIALHMNGAWYWSSTPKKSGSTNYIYEKNFEEGKTYDTGSNAKRSVRCMRKL